MCHNSQVAIIVEILLIVVLPKVQRKCVSDAVEAISGVSMIFKIRVFYKA